MRQLRAIVDKTEATVGHAEILSEATSTKQCLISSKQQVSNNK